MDLTEIENIRKSKRITTREFAEKCDIEPDRYCDIKFKRVNPTADEAKRIFRQATRLIMNCDDCNKYITCQYLKHRFGVAECDSDKAECVEKAYAKELEDRKEMLKNL